MKTKLLLLVVSFFVSSTSLLATVTLSASMPVNGIQNLTYTGSYSASGGTTPYTFSVSSGVLPAGLSLSSTLGTVTGHPTATSFASYTFTVKVTDSSAPQQTATSTMTVYVAQSGTGMHNVVYPASSGVIDVTQSPYSADNTGSTDVSGVLQQAISAVASGSTSTRDTIIYFPAGTYKVASPLVWGSCSGGLWTWSSYISLVGHSKADTIIKLASSASGFSTGSNPAINSSGCTSILLPSRAVIFTGPNAGLGGVANTNVGNPNAYGNTGFRNHIMNLTVDTGTGNSGAIGIDYLGSNNCRLSDVNIISDDNNGDTGLSMQRQYQGPDLIKYVTIAGFTKGIAMGSGYANWLEHIVLNRQTTAGVYFASGDVATIRDLKSNNSVPAVTNTSNGASLSLIDSTLQGGSSSNYAVNNTAGSPRVFIRNTTETGYLGLASGTNATTCATEWLSNAALNATSPVSTCSLNLSVSETPVFSSDDYTVNSASVLSFSGVSANDPTADYASAISTAINTSTATTIYFPYGIYYIASPITINHTSHVQRLIFFGSKLSPSNSGFSGSEVIDIQNIPSQGFWIQNLLLVTNYSASQSFPSATSGTPIILQEATATAQVVILNSENISYTSNSGAGTVYFESVNYGPFIFNGQTVYARHLNPEFYSTTQAHVAAAGGSVWILGLKTENRDSPGGSTTPVPILSVSNATGFEVLGGSIYGANTYAASAAMCTLSNSSVSISGLTTGINSGGDYDEWISETRNGNSGIICANGYTLGACSSVPHSYTRPTGSVIPLYIGH